MRESRGLGLFCLAWVVCGCVAAKPGDGAATRLVCRSGRVAPLTSGPGNDTEAAWSPDGSRIAFQTDASGDMDLAVADAKSGRREVVVAGAGHACYPAWTPDGRLVYSFGHHPETAQQAAAQGRQEGFNLRLWEGEASPRVLTRGYWRDYAPCVTGDGAAVYFTSTRASEGNSASLWKMPLAPEAAAEPVLQLDGASAGAVQPSASPGGRFLAWAHLDGFRQNWRLCAANVTNLQESVFLTPGEMSAYAPRWSPDGALIAFTGFRLGDPGWGVYVLEPRSGAMARLDTGEGNARSPAWSPDGKELVFENNRSGLYKLCRLPVSCRIAPGRAAPVRGEVAPHRVEARLERCGGTAALAAPSGARVAETGSGAGSFERPEGLDFGAGPFYVKVTLVADRPAGATRIAAVGRYAGHALGWQVFVRESGRLCFSSRGPGGQFVGVESDAAVKAGQATTVVGVRDADGGLRMSVNGVMQKGRAAGATFAYGPALSVCLGRQWSGGMRLEGRVERFECGRGTPPGVPRVLTREQLFAEGEP